MCLCVSVCVFVCAFFINRGKSYFSAFNGNNSVCLSVGIEVIRHSYRLGTRGYPFLLRLRINLEDMCLCREDRMLTL